MEDHIHTIQDSPVPTQPLLLSALVTPIFFTVTALAVPVPKDDVSGDASIAVNLGGDKSIGLIMSVSMPSASLVPLSATIGVLKRGGGSRGLQL
ncbi:hypothetical protein N7447_010368 [Penicillium robsamsonii]|uniref:uncharacterized protein n=1 Tax=Penicillium robsamsonii TaxID=1792511 RepID=UPI0025499789|nr:uncharacterized protein N7447_010368 [Penicillium robsamsonii]KAJ5810852.1 hypothetical protein N7447_010368 [Penicillium robsamsonii]